MGKAFQLLSSVGDLNVFILCFFYRTRSHNVKHTTTTTALYFDFVVIVIITSNAFHF